MGVLRFADRTTGVATPPDPTRLPTATARRRAAPCTPGTRGRATRTRSWCHPGAPGSSGASSARRLAADLADQRDAGRVALRVVEQQGRLLAAVARELGLHWLAAGADVLERVPVQLLPVRVGATAFASRRGGAQQN